MQLLVLCFIIVPTLAYLVGAWLIGPYQGVFGLFGYVGSIYRDALRAEPSAWILLLSPLMIIAIWQIVLRRNKAE